MTRVFEVQGARCGGNPHLKSEMWGTRKSDFSSIENYSVEVRLMKVGSGISAFTPYLVVHPRSLKMRASLRKPTGAYAYL